jgi:hypothetical protein
LTVATSLAQCASAQLASQALKPAERKFNLAVRQGKDMAGLRVQLSPKEECTLRRIVLGMSGKDELRARYLKRLIALDLVRIVDRDLTVTQAGMDRYREVPQRFMPAPTRRRANTRFLPF